MNKFKIFAQYGTTNRRLVNGYPDIKNVEIMRKLNEQHGGSWVLVQDLKPGECIPFEADKPYIGFDGGDDYCGVIEKI